jgi:tetratricopeptide (TPR) repeat protein
VSQRIAQTSATGDAAFDAVIEAHGEATEELFGELGEAVLALAPSRMVRLVPVLPGNVNLLSRLGWKAIEAGEREQALALYERMLALPIPDDGPGRMNYLRAMNNACVQAHAARAYDTAVRIADRAQPVAHENPNLYHSAACAYAAVGARSKALEMVQQAIDHDYDQLEKLETDPDLGDLRGSPELTAMFRAWRAKKGTV